MDLLLHWHAPITLFHTREMIYDLLELTTDDLPKEAGVYLFTRTHSKNVYPLYIGRAENLQRRIRQQLNNVKLMRGIERAPTGERRLFIAQILTKRNQNPAEAIKIVESALISTAMVEGHDLLNVSGTKSLAHTITSSGNREARKWLPENVIKLRRA